MMRSAGWMVVIGVAIAGCGGSTSAPGPGPGSGPGSDALEPPSEVSAQGAGFGPGGRRCTLTWTAPAEPVDGYEISTSVPGWSFDDGDTHGGIAPGIATQATLMFPPSAVELTPVDIQIRSRDHGAVSAFAPTVTCVLSVDSPTENGVLLTSAGVALTWFNASQVATAVEIDRAPLDASGAPGAWAAIATVPPMTSDLATNQTYVDATAVAVGAAYAYRISSIAPTGERGTTPVMATVARGAPLVDGTVSLPAAPIAVADGQGNFALASFTAGFTVTWSHGGTVGHSPTLAAQAFPPFVRLDAAGLPHTVYVANGEITHGWSDGTQWHEEVIGPLGFVQIVDIVPLRFTLDANGAPVVVWTLDTRRYQLATKAAGTWTVQSLDALIPGPTLTPFMVFTDGAGVPHIVVSTLFGLRHLERRAAAWTSELVASNEPVGDPVFGGGADPDHLVVCSDSFTFSFFVQPACVRKTPAGWTAPAPLGVVQENISNTMITGQVAISGDGEQLAVLYQAPGSEAQLFRSTAGGAWTEIVLPALDAVGGVAPTAFVGFDAAQKLFLLVDPTAATDAGQASVAYRLSHAP